MSRVAAKIVHVTTAHPPFDVRIFHKECATLAAAGFEVVLIAPSDKSERVGDVEIRALPNRVSRLLRMLVAAPMACRLALRERAAAYHVHDPELLPVALLLRLLGYHSVYDAHEDLPRQVLTKPWIPPVLRGSVSWLVERFEAFAVGKLSRVVAATPAIGSRFSPEKAVLVQNYPNGKGSGDDPGAAYCDRPLELSYIGGLHAGRGAAEMVEAIGLVAARGLDASLTIAGSIHPPEMAGTLSGLQGWSRVSFVGWLSRQEIGDLLGRSRAGLVVFHPEPNHTNAQPNKLFEYMAAGLPVIASAFPLWRQIIESARCGLLVDPLDPEAIAEAMEWVLRNPEEAAEMGARGRAAVRLKYNWESEGARLVAMYQGLLA